jgi:hypothetical protein
MKCTILHLNVESLNQTSNQHETNKATCTSLFGLLLDLEDGSSKFLRNVRERLLVKK